MYLTIIFILILYKYIYVHFRCYRPTKNLFSFIKNYFILYGISIFICDKKVEIT